MVLKLRVRKGDDEYAGECGSSKLVLRGENMETKIPRVPSLTQPVQVLTSTILPYNLRRLSLLDEDLGGSAAVSNAAHLLWGKKLG